MTKQEAQKVLSEANHILVVAKSEDGNYFVPKLLLCIKGKDNVYHNVPCEESIYWDSEEGCYNLGEWTSDIVRKLFIDIYDGDNWDMIQAFLKSRPNLDMEWCITHISEIRSKSLQNKKPRFFGKGVGIRRQKNDSERQWAKRKV